MVTNAVPESPSVTYRVVWVDENGNHIDAYEDLTSEEADAKVLDCKYHGFHAYKAVEQSATVQDKERV